MVSLTRSTTLPARAWQGKLRLRARAGRGRPQLRAQPKFPRISPVTDRVSRHYYDSSVSVRLHTEWPMRSLWQARSNPSGLAVGFLDPLEVAALRPAATLRSPGRGIEASWTHSRKAQKASSANIALWAPLYRDFYTRPAGSHGSAVEQALACPWRQTAGALEGLRDASTRWVVTHDRQWGGETSRSGRMGLSGYRSISLRRCGRASRCAPSIRWATISRRIALSLPQRSCQTLRV